MQGIMHAARVAPRGRNTGGAHPFSSTIEPDELPLRKRRPASPPELCVGRQTTDKHSQETACTAGKAVCSYDKVYLTTLGTRVVSVRDAPVSQDTLVSRLGLLYMTC